MLFLIVRHIIPDGSPCIPDGYPSNLEGKVINILKKTNLIGYFLLME